MMTIWKLTLWKVSGVNDTLGHILLRQSLSAKYFWERESLRLVPRDPNLVNATNNVNVLIFVLHICPIARLCLAHSAYFSWSIWTSHKTLLASLSSNFFFGDSKRGKGNSSMNSWLIVRLGRTNFPMENDALFGHTSEFNWKNVANQLIHGGFIFSFMKFVIISIFTKTDLCASHDVIIKFSKEIFRKETQSFLIFKFYSLIYLQVINFSYSAKYSTSAITMLPRELRSNSRLVTHANRLLFLSSLLQVTSSNSTAHILSNFLVSNNLSQSTHFSLWILHPQNRMLFMSSAHGKKVALLGTISKQSSVLQRYQELWQGRQSQSPPPALQNHELWQ